MRCGNTEFIKQKIDLPAPRLNREGVVYNNTYLTTEISKAIRNNIRGGFQHVSDWNLLYSNYEHGLSYKRLLDIIEGSRGVYILVVRTSENDIFGSFFEARIELSNRFFGNCKTFLWKSEQKPAPLIGIEISIFPATQKNTLYMLCQREHFSFGCSEGAYGLYIDKNLRNGQSNPVDTFDNVCLSRSKHFIVDRIEIWNVF